MPENSSPSPAKRLQFAHGKPFEVVQPHINRVLSKPTVSEVTAIPRGTLDDWVSRGLFPAPIALGPRRIGWLESDVQAWILSRPMASRILPSSDGTPMTQQADSPPIRRRGRPTKTVATNPVQG